MNVKNKTKIILIMFLILPMIYCSQKNINDQGNDKEERWLIPKSEVVDGGPGRDGIPALENPKMVPASLVTFMSDNELVVGVRKGNTIKAFPHKILDYHEIVNDISENIYYVLSYCPLTGTALLWDIENSGGDPTFGVSGLLYNSNLILYDRKSGSYWSQIFFKCVSGSRIEEKAKLSNVVETTWATWKKLYPESEVLSTDTGYNRNYDDYPYGKYKSTNNLLFPVSNEDPILHSKERIHGIVLEGKTVVFTIRSFTGGINVLNRDEGEIVVVINAEDNFAVSFSRKLDDGKLLEFSPVKDKYPVIMKDKSGSEWDIFGRAVSGSRRGTQLNPVNSFTSYWFGWVTFFSAPEIIEGNSPLI